MADSVDDVAENGSATTGAAADGTSTGATAAPTAALVATAVERSEEDSPTRRRRRSSSGHRGRDVVQCELHETLTERQAFEVRLRQLSAEIRLCEASHEALLQKEQYLIKEANAIPGPGSLPVATLEEFLEGNKEDLPPPEEGELGPVFFTLEGDGAVSSDALDDDDSASIDGEWWGDDTPEDGRAFDNSQDMEEVLDNVGIARCRHCGIRLPLDVTAIEEHCRTCFDTEEALDANAEEDSSTHGLMGRCAQCGEELPLTPEGIERHVCAVDGDLAGRKQASKAPTPASKAPTPKTAKEKSSQKRSWWRGGTSKSKAKEESSQT